MAESKFQSDLRKEIENHLPGNKIILKNENKNGISDLTILYKNKWALLENKDYEKAHHQPNQDLYVDMADEMSFGRFIYPENRQEVLDELYDFFGVQ